MEAMQENGVKSIKTARIIHYKKTDGAVEWLGKK